MNILQVKDLKTYLYSSHGIIKAVDGVSFDIRKGEVFGIVGESGSGKTMTACSILKLLPYGAKVVDGKILFNNTDLMELDEERLRDVRGRAVSMVFQEPGSSFNPVFTIAEQMIEAILAHRKNVTKAGAHYEAISYLKKVHIQDPERIFSSYPHQLSGGTKQRVMIAMALINSPELLILDEPTTALDVTIQAQILDLLEEIIEGGELSILFISHDFGIIARMCDRVAVMYKGKIVETGLTEQVLSSPKDPYTVSLLESVKALA